MKKVQLRRASKTALQGENTDKGEPKFRLRPRRPKAPRQGDMAWSVALKTIYRYARSSASAPRSTGSQLSASRRLFEQRCAVRVTYSSNRMRGQWRAHGVYIARESATKDPAHAGFGHAATEVDVANTLREWQEAGDVRLWKVIVSPEFGERVDLERLTRDMVKQAERELGTPLEWVAVTHFNTEHPHVHLAIRGRRKDGADLTLTRRYVQHGLREAAGKACTLQLGPRTELDAITAAEREVTERRFTSLDRVIERLTLDGGDSRFIHVQTQSDSGDVRQQQVTSRLAALQTMGLAAPVTGVQWHVRRDFQTVLHAMQRAHDRQKMLAVKGSLLSDPRLRVVVTDARQIRELQGRVVLHGEDEQTGRNYMLLEGTDAQVQFMYYAPEMEAARSKDKLRVNSFVRLQRQSVNGQPLLEIDDRGDANAVLKNKAFLADASQRLNRRGVIPKEDGWSGWLGVYQRTVRQAAMAGDKERIRHELVRGR